jgi:hypothetical protein
MHSGRAAPAARFRRHPDATPDSGNAYDSARLDLLVSATAARPAPAIVIDLTMDDASLLSAEDLASPLSYDASGAPAVISKVRYCCVVFFSFLA